jgi:carboxyl-terminal processing protease
MEVFVNKLMKAILIVSVSLVLLTGSFAGGFVTRHYLAGSDLFPEAGESVAPVIPPILSTPSTSSASPKELESLFKPFWEAWDIVHNQYVDQPVDDVALMQGAIRGMLEALGDKQTFYMDPKTYESETSSLQGEYEGIGAYVDTEGDYLTIVSPIGGSPAEAAGLRPGDKIIAIDGEDMTGYTPEQARQKVLGPAGTEVTLTIAREGEAEPLIFVITRARITIASVTGEMRENGIAYIDINSFGDKTTRELDAVVKELLQQNPKGVIIDLRNNPGGYLTTSVEVASEFIKDGVVLYEQYGNGSRDVYNARGNGRMTEIPIVVLINEGSASASEIVAGALQDYGRATLVGVQSYGKGSVQNWVPLSNDMGAARVTIAKWLTPKERAIDGVGLTPDVVVEMTEEDYNNNRDPQLDKAVEVLLGLIAKP